jgi:hypothetical protein
LIKDRQLLFRNPENEVIFSPIKQNANAKIEPVGSACFEKRHGKCD